MSCRALNGFQRLQRPYGNWKPVEQEGKEFSNASAFEMSFWVRIYNRETLLTSNHSSQEREEVQSSQLRVKGVCRIEGLEEYAYQMYSHGEYVYSPLTNRNYKGWRTDADLNSM